MQMQGNEPETHIDANHHGHKHLQATIITDVKIAFCTIIVMQNISAFICFIIQLVFVIYMFMTYNSNT